VFLPSFKKFSSINVTGFDFRCPLENSEEEIMKMTETGAQVVQIKIIEGKSEQIFPIP
jgi:hypothetical protein